MLKILTLAALLHAAASGGSAPPPKQVPVNGAQGTCDEFAPIRRHAKPMEDPRISFLLRDERKIENQRLLESSIVKLMNCASARRQRCSCCPPA